MKKVKLRTFMKKLTAYALVAAMTVSAPLTAVAAEFSDNFSQSAGKSDSNSDSETGTVSSTDTNTTVLRENAGRITGLLIYDSKGAIIASHPQNPQDIESIVMTPGKSEKLTASVLISESLKDMTLAQLNEKIVWRSSNPQVAAVSAKSGSMNKCTINARNAGEARITASLDTNQDGTYDYVLCVGVQVFEPSKDDVKWNITDKFYTKWTYCLSDYLTINGKSLGDTTTDVITFAVKGSAKVATINGEMLTVKGAGEITLVAVLPNKEIVESEKITTSAGNPVKKLLPMVSGEDGNKVELDFGGGGEKEDPNPTKEVSVEVIPTDEGATTDIITWISSNPSVATVEEDPTEPNNQTKAVICAQDVGKTTITVKSTSGKTAKFSVTVKATLVRIESVSLNNISGYAWSGKTESLNIVRVPDKNKDKLKVSSSDTKLVKVKSAVNNVTITPANDLTKFLESEDGEGNAESATVTITVESNDKYSEAEPKEVEIKVKQSDVEIKKVTDVSDTSENAKDMNKQTIKANHGETYDYALALNEKQPIPGEDAVSWVSSNVKVATVNNGHLEVVGQGTAKITVSSIYKNAKKKYVQSKKVFTIKSTPMCDEIVLKSNVAAYDLSKSKKGTVTINIKQQTPKKAADEIEWYVNGEKKVPKKNVVTDKKITLSQSDFKGLTAGGTVEVMAVSKKNPSAYVVATVYVIRQKAKKVAFAKKEVSLKNVGDTEIVKTSVTEKSCNDPIVSYMVDKKGVSVVRAEMTRDGNLKLTGVGEGKATVSALTASGKKGTLKVTVAVKKK